VHGHLTKKPEEIGAGDQGHMFGYGSRLYTCLLTAYASLSVLANRLFVYFLFGSVLNSLQC
jgi:S-adenosylmethionine synthetase